MLARRSLRRNLTMVAHNEPPTSQGGWLVPRVKFASSEACPSGNDPKRLSLKTRAISPAAYRTRFLKPLPPFLRASGPGSLSSEVYLAAKVPHESHEENVNQPGVINTDETYPAERQAARLGTKSYSLGTPAPFACQPSEAPISHRRQANIKTSECG